MRTRPFTTAGLAAVLITTVLHTAAAATAAVPPALAAIDALARARPAAAVVELKQYAGSTAAAPTPVRRAVLLRLRRAYLDLGDYPAAEQVSASLRALGQQRHDAASLAWASINDIEQLLRSFRSDDAKAALDRLGDQINLSAMPELALAVHMGYGRLYLLRGEHERAIERFQAAVHLAPATDDPASAQVDALRNLAYCYMALDDTPRAHIMVSKALEANDNSVRAHLRGLLYLAEAVVLTELSRYKDAEAAFAHALAVSRDGDLRVVEARVLGDWAELALRQEQYASAERLARQALQVAQAIGDAGMATTARANLGFALGGQGKLAEGLPYIDAVVEHFRQQGNGQSLLATLDEKGHMLERQGWLKETVAVLREQQRLARAQFTEQRVKAVAALQGRFELDQNRHRIELLQKQGKLKDVELRNRELRLVALALAVLSMVAVGALLALLYRRAHKSNVQLQALNSRLTECAERDPLTALHNRRAFADIMLSRPQRASGERGPSMRGADDTFMVLDLDHFKAVNDTHGHAAGDSVLVELAKRLLAAVRDTDTVARWGGEEFVIYLPHCGPQQSAQLAQRILDVVSGAPFAAGNALLPVTISIGMVEVPFAGWTEADCDWQRALGLADAALYLAKGAGRNRCQQLLPVALPPSSSPAALVADLASAISAGHVMLHTILPSVRDQHAA